MVFPAQKYPFSVSEKFSFQTPEDLNAFFNFFLIQTWKNASYFYQILKLYVPEIDKYHSISMIFKIFLTITFI